ncbi:DUF6676 family protein [Nocardioides solisilvae]|uniref:Rv1476 family membrane protein n=1 Tax=Nocardioides solisilvae TaxID=1542435 RepID=UPI000D746FC6|nr:DUF6676 family protein [Nocardioides solisilvae]
MSDAADVEAIVADLREDGVHVAPGAQDWVPAEQLDAISAQARESGIPLHVVLVPPEGGGTSRGDDLLFRVHDAGGPDGLYVGLNAAYQPGPGEKTAGDPVLVDGSRVFLSVQQWGDVAERGEITSDVEDVLSWGNAEGGVPDSGFPLGDGLQLVLASLADGTFEQEVRDAQQARSDWLEVRSEERQDQEGTGVAGWIPFADDENGVGDVVGVLLLGAVALALLGRFRRRRRERLAAPQTFVLPRSVLERVRAAGDAELVRRARQDVLALGEAIDATEMSPAGAGSGGAAAWAAALDHYEAAGRVLPADSADAAVDPLDAVGAVVLATRGLEALAAAERGSAFEPSTPCFLNPLHGTATVDRTLEADGRTVEAPICRACRADLEAGRRPDTLDVVVDGTPRHYFETDREPWALTGFGALEPDLVRRLHTGGGR